MSTYIAELRQDPRYQNEILRAKRETPPIPEFVPGHNHSVETWAYESGRRAGWMACAQHFGVMYDERDPG